MVQTHSALTKARVICVPLLHFLFHPLVLLSQVGEGVDDNSEDDVDKDRVDENEES